MNIQGRSRNVVIQDNAMFRMSVVGVVELALCNDGLFFVPGLSHLLGSPEQPICIFYILPSQASNSDYSHVSPTSFYHRFGLSVLGMRRSVQHLVYSVAYFFAIFTSPAFNV